MALLGVNVDHVATLRQARREEDPDPILAAKVCERNGAHSIVAHLREDRRHIQDRDVLVLRRVVKKSLNLEMSLSPQIVELALKIKPDQVTIVPERRQELTTEGGFDAIRSMKTLAKVAAQMQKRGIVTSVFIAPDKKQVEAVKDCGINTIELHTGEYARDFSVRRSDAQLRQLRFTVAFALKNGLIVNAGHGLNYDNVRPIAEIEGIHELNIGHAIIARAIFCGLDKAVRDMSRLVK